MREFRASKLPSGMTCAGSVHDNEHFLKLESSSQEAKLGSAVHQWLEERIDGRRDPRESTEHVVAKFGVDPQEVESVGADALALFDEIAKFFPQPQTEVAMREEFPKHGVAITGHLDLVDVSNRDHLYVVDWKTGWRECDHYHQAAGYARLARAYAESKDAEVTVFFIWPRLKLIDGIHFTTERINSWSRDFLSKIVNWDYETFNVGEHCDRCCHRATCNAYITERTSAIQGFIANPVPPASELAESNPSRFLILRRQIKWIKKECERAQSILDEQIRRLGKVEANGERLVNQIQKKSFIHPRRAIEILERHLKPEDIDRAYKVTKSKVEEALKAKVDNGQKAEFVRGVFAELREAGALNDVQTTRIVKEVVRDVQ